MPDQREEAETLIRLDRNAIVHAVALHFDILRQDLRYASRALLRAPGFALTAILVVALGVGANTAAFSLADFVLLRPFPYANPEQLVQIWGTTDGQTRFEFSPPNFRDFRAMNRSFSEMAAYNQGKVNLVGEGVPRRLRTARVTPELMPMMGVRPLLGRTIMATDKPSDAVVVLGHDVWRSEFGSDVSVVGRVLRFDGAPYTVVGVMPAAFRFPSREVDVWVPSLLSEVAYQNRSNLDYNVVARLKRGVTIEQARAEIVSLMERLAQQYPNDNSNIRALVQPLRNQLGTRARLLVIALCGAALCILLLACSNLASLLLARGANRTRELAVRAALGAGRDRLIRQLMTESIVLAFLGGIVGLAVAAAGMPLLTRLVPTQLPVAEVPSLDLRVLGFAAALMVVTGLVFGVIPAVRAGKGEGLDSLRERTTSSPKQRIRAALVALEVTGSIVLLISCGLLLRAAWRIEALQVGFESAGVMTLRTDLPLPKYAPTAARQPFYKRVLDEVRALPGVQSAAYATGVPMAMRGGIRGVTVDGIDGGRDRSNTASLRFLTPGFFATLGIPLLRGRDFQESDAQGAPNVAVVSESFARRQWPDQDPLNRRFGFVGQERTVVGVVGDVRVRGREQRSEPQVYLPSAQAADTDIGYIPQVLVIRATTPPERWMSSVRAIISSADPEQPISDVRPLSEIVSDDMAPRHVQLRLLLVLSSIALLIAGVGLHGLLSLGVSQRMQELGVRRALGAQTSTIVNLVLGEGLRLTAVGAAAGVVIALVIARGMRTLLADVPPNDPRTILAAVALCLITALIGCLHPAWRATRVDPMTALRQE